MSENNNKEYLSKPLLNLKRDKRNKKNPSKENIIKPSQSMIDINNLLDKLKEQNEKIKGNQYEIIAEENNENFNSQNQNLFPDSNLKISNDFKFDNNISIEENQPQDRDISKNRLKAVKKIEEISENHPINTDNNEMNNSKLKDNIIESNLFDNNDAFQYNIDNNNNNINDNEGYFESVIDKNNDNKDYFDNNAEIEDLNKKQENNKISYMNNDNDYFQIKESEIDNNISKTNYIDIDEELIKKEKEEEEKLQNEKKNEGEQQEEDNSNDDEELLQKKKEDEELQRQEEELQRQKEEEELQRQKEEEELKRQEEELQRQKEEQELQRQKEEEEEKNYSLNQETPQEKAVSENNDKNNHVSPENIEIEEYEEDDDINKNNNNNSKEKNEITKKHESSSDDSGDNNKNEDIPEVKEEPEELARLKNAPKNKSNKEKDQASNYIETPAKEENDDNVDEENIEINFEELLKDEPEKIEKNKKDFNEIESKKKKNDIAKIINKINNYCLYYTESGEEKVFTNYSKEDEDNLTTQENFKEKVIDKETAKSRKYKRKNLINFKAFSGQIAENDELLNCYCEIPKQHLDEMKEIFNNSGGNDFINKIKDISEDEIFVKENLLNYEEENCENIYPIHDIYNIDNFIYKYGIHDNIFNISQIYDSFYYWRPCLQDGNSFYRMFMFSLIENFILNNNIKQLLLLVCEMTSETYYNFLCEKKINTDIFYGIFKIIINYLNQKDTINAYKIFLDAYKLKDNIFDLGLIFFLRKIFSNYLNEIYGIYEIKFSNIINNKKKKKSKIEKINCDALEFLGIETQFFMMNLLPLLFNINLICFWIDEEFNKQTQNIINFFDEENPKYPTIRLGCIYSVYYSLYSKDIDSNNTFLNFIPENINNIDQLAKISEGNYNCKVCNNSESKLVYIKQIRQYFCDNCLENHIKEVIDNRVLNFINSNYVGIEYCLRPIFLGETYYLDEFEFIEIYGQSLLNLVYDIISSKCVQCLKNFEKEQLIQLKCLCKYCEDCLIAKINDATQEFKVLNNYEKNNLEKKHCWCGQNFNLDEAVKKCKIPEEFTEHAKLRMVNYVKTLCANCCKDLTKLVNENGEQKYIDIEQGSYKILNINGEDSNAPNYNLDFNGDAHLMCNNCYDQIMAMNSENKTQVFHCNICCKDHAYGGEREEKKNEDGKCCGGCLIF